MAGFKTHITTSSLLGVGYATAGYLYADVPASTCVLAGCLCGVSGMLPDLDSDSGIPLRESLAFGAAVVPMLLLERFERLGMSMEMIALAGAGVYLVIRFFVGALLRKYTVHRGMFHSLPALLIAGQVAFLLCASGDLPLRLFKSGGVMVGFLSHLLLDELYSIEWHRGRLRLKKSFGTAMKLWGRSTWGNVSTYGKLALLTLLVLNDPVVVDNITVASGIDTQADEINKVATTLLKQLRQ